MSTDSIEHGVRVEARVTRHFSVRCDDAPSGFIEVSKTPPTGANAMTVTIKPLYGEAFTVNADLLREAMWLALDSRTEKFEEAYHREHWRRSQIERVDVGDRVQIADRGRVNYKRTAIVESVDEFYLHVVIDQEPVEIEEGVPVLRRKIPRSEVLGVYAREGA